jgi:hypothetical protein
MLYRYAIDSVRTQIELIQGSELNDDPSVSIFPNIKSMNLTTSQFYVQFIPICTDKNITSYEYSISIDDKSSSIDVYFVDSKKQFENYLLLINLISILMMVALVKIIIVLVEFVKILIKNLVF